MKMLRYQAITACLCLIALALQPAVSQTPPAGRDSSVLPGDPPAGFGEPVQLQVLRAGPAPYAWTVPGLFASSFITNTPDQLEVVAAAKVSGHPELDEQIRWEVMPPTGFRVPVGAKLSGPQLSLRLDRPGGNPTGGGSPLSLTVVARAPVDGRERRAVRTLEQDLRDRLRQEYVDLRRSGIPDRETILDREQFADRMPREVGAVGFDELNWSRRPDTGDRYPFVIATPRLISVLAGLRKAYGAVTITSAFRNPVHQETVHASVDESHHQYGRAADLGVAPDSCPPRTGRTTASPADWLRLAAAAVRAGGVWIEPMTSCHVDTAGCHVHVDVREEGSPSRIVMVGGRVLDATGLPIARARVRLAGMPAETNADGQFLLKHVIVPRPIDVAVEADGRGILTQEVDPDEDPVNLVLRYPNEPLPVLRAAMGAREVNAEGKTVIPIRLRNEGAAAATQVRIVGNAEGSVERVWPQLAPSLPAGGEVSFRLVVPAPSPSSVGLQAVLEVPELTAHYQTSKGAPRRQSLELRGNSVDTVMLQPPVPGTVPGEAEVPSVAPIRRELAPVAPSPYLPEETLPQRLIRALAVGLSGLAIGVLAGLLVLSLYRLSGYLTDPQDESERVSGQVSGAYSGTAAEAESIEAPDPQPAESPSVGEDFSSPTMAADPGASLEEAAPDSPEPAATGVADGELPPAESADVDPPDSSDQLAVVSTEDPPAPAPITRPAPGLSNDASSAPSGGPTVGVIRDTPDG